MTRFALFLLVLLTFAWTPRAASADDTLRVVAAFPGGIEVLENVAKFGGLFRAEHLDVDKEYSGSAAACAQLTASGKADVCAASMEPAIQGYSKGLHLVDFLSRIANYEYLLAVLDDSPIKTLADFRGKQVGEPNPASATEIAANDMLQGAGLRKSDYTYVPVGAGAQALSALISHKVDGLSDSASALGTEGAVSHLKFRYFKDPILDSVPDAGFAASPETIAAKGDLLGRYARAIVKSAILIRENPAVAARYALMGESIGAAITPQALAIEKQELIGLQGHLIGADPTSKRIGDTPLNGIAFYCKLMFDDGLTPALVPASALVTDRFVTYANDFDHNAWIAEVKRMH
jgi:NitT/TauT family transport system substrate-binding protein